MITMDDVVGSVVGAFDVGYELEETLPRQIRKYEELANGVYLMDGRLPIHEVNDVLGVELPTTEFHTIGGMLIARLHHLAKPGESVVESGYCFTVQGATEKIVTPVRAE